MHDDRNFTVIEQHITYSVFGQTVPASRLDAAIANPDALQVAYQVGVLELLSISLTILGVVIALGALAGFWMIRRAAIAASQTEAKSWISQEGPRLIEEYLRSQGLSGAGESVPLKPNINLSQNQVTDVLDEAEEITEDNGGARK